MGLRERIERLEKALKPEVKVRYIRPDWRAERAEHEEGRPTPDPGSGEAEQRDGRRGDANE